METYSRNKNVEIKGIPKQPDEQPLQVILKLAAAVKVPLKPEDIDVCHRVPSFGRKEEGKPPLIVQFTTRCKRDEFLKTSRRMRPTLGSLGYDKDSQAQIYVNEHLTPKKKVLLYEVAQWRKNNDWKFMWTDGGNIFVRKAQDTKAHKIDCLEDLSKPLQ